MLLTPPKQKLIVIEPVKSGLSFKISFNAFDIVFTTLSIFSILSILLSP